MDFRRGLSERDALKLEADLKGLKVTKLEGLWVTKFNGLKVPSIKCLVTKFKALKVTNLKGKPTSKV